MIEKDTYNTILKPSVEVLFKDKNSKFFGYAFPVTSIDQIKVQIELLKKEHHAARHWCYAYQIGHESVEYRVNDDGEPNNSAGQPIYGQIQSFDVTNILIVVVRYFGGVKLGVGGLINAYRTAAQMALEDTSIVTRTINKKYRLTFDYKFMNKVMRIIKEKKIKITNQTSELNCVIEISIRKKYAESVYNTFKQLHEITISEL
jgi:uncharacterized YigZ family protein